MIILDFIVFLVFKLLKIDAFVLLLFICLRCIYMMHHRILATKAGLKQNEVKSNGIASHRHWYLRGGFA
jgi:hypothetical protein